MTAPIGVTDLPLQPRESTLTLAGFVRVAGRTLVVALCFCGAFLRLRAADWRDGSRRPRSCVRCARRRLKTQQAGDLLWLRPRSAMRERSVRDSADPVT